MKNKLQYSEFYQQNPIEYSIGFCKFLNCKIDLSLKPMIPRTETEYWTRKVIEEIKRVNKKVRCLDIFAGSGCIGIAVLKNCPELCRRMDLADIDGKFLKQIKINLKLNKISSKKYKLIQSDVFQKITSKYDYIFANPPYVAFLRKRLVQKSVLDFEPETAIFAGKDGLFYIKKFFKKAKRYLKLGSKIYLEFDYFQKKEIEKILSEFNYNPRFFKDQYKKWRYVVIKY